MSNSKETANLLHRLCVYENPAIDENLKNDPASNFEQGLIFFLKILSSAGEPSPETDMVIDDLYVELMADNATLPHNTAIN